MLLKKTDVNTGRQEEFDLLKGLFIPMILVIHAFQIMGGTSGLFYQVVYGAGTMTGVTIFMFVMGLGSTYSGRTPGQMAVTGLKLLLWEVLWDLLAMLLPLFIGQSVRAAAGLPVAADQAFMLGSVYVQYINVFFIAGISYLLLALLRRLRLPPWGYLALAAALLIAVPFLYMDKKTTGIPAIDYLLTMFAGGRPAVSLCFLPNFVYVLFGVWFGHILRRAPDKSALYRRVWPFALAAPVAYLCWIALKSASSDAFFYSLSYGYVFPDSWRMLANTGCTMFAAWAFFALRRHIPAKLRSGLNYLCRNTTQYYAVHPFLYLLAFSAANLTAFSPTACIIGFLVNSAACYFALRLWDNMKRRKTA